MLLWLLAPAVAIVLAGYMTAVLLSLSPLKTYSSGSNPLSLSTVLTITTLVAGLCLYFEKADAEHTYSRKNRELITTGSFFGLFTVFVLSAAYIVLPAIAKSNCAESSYLIFSCLFQGDFWINLTLASIAIHLFLLALLLFGCILLYQFRIPTGVAKKDLITGNAHLISRTLSKVAALRSTHSVIAEDEHTLWANNKTPSGKIKIYSHLVGYCALNIVLLSILKLVPLIAIVKLGGFSLKDANFSFTVLLVFPATSSLLLVSGLYFIFTWKLEYTSQSLSISANAMGIWLVILAILCDFIIAAKLASFLAIIIFALMTFAYGFVWHTALGNVIHRNPKVSTITPFQKPKANGEQLSIENIQNLLSCPRKKSFRKYHTSIFLLPKFDDRFSSTHNICLLEQDDNADSPTPRSQSTNRFVQFLKIERILKKKLTIDSFSTLISLVELIENGLKLRSNQLAYDEAGPGETINFERLKSTRSDKHPPPLLKRFRVRTVQMQITLTGEA